MKGMSQTTGKPLSGIDHLRQSIVDILTTPLGSRVMHRDYGSELFDLIDAPINQRTLVDIYTATAKALQRWEPRFNLTRVYVEKIVLGRVHLRLEGEVVNAKFTQIKTQAQQTKTIQTLEGIVI